MQRQYSNYLFEYRHDGARWSLTIPATSREDAQERVKQIHYARLIGTEVMTIPARAGFIASPLCWLRNLLAAAPYLRKGRRSERPAG